jgi:hypothetical protein
LKQILKITLAVGLAIFFATSIKAQDGPPPPPPPPPPARDVPLVEWKTFQSEVGKFSVLVPIPPKEEQQMNGPSKIYVFRSFTSQQDFKLTYVELPNAAPDVKTLWERTKPGMTARKEMKLVSEKMIEANGTPGLELTAESEFAFMQIRFFTSGNGIYQLTALSLNKKTETLEARAFLDSFKLLDVVGEKQAKQEN